MASRKLIIVDLDRTLFDSDRFYIDICKALERVGKLSQAQLAEAVALLSDPEATPYITDLVEKFSIDDAGIEEVLLKELKPNHYLYPDAGPFLKRWAKHQLAIVTTGIKRYQTLKFQISPLLDGTAQHIINEINKGVYLKQRLVYQDQELQVRGVADSGWYPELYLIDDRNYNLNALAGSKHVTLFHIRRPSEKAGSNQLAAGINVISSLEEVL